LKSKFDVNSSVIAQYDYRKNPDGWHAFSCIQDLLDFLDKYDTSDCFFRGQSGLWDVTSSLYRHKDKEQHFKKACNISVFVVNWLKQNKYIKEVVNNNDDYALAIAQHYGCPTDLVDITTDYRTAAYFAVSENDKHGEMPEGCVWVFPKGELKRLQQMMRTPPKGLLSKIPRELIDKFVENNGSPLLQFDIPQLSRFNAQCGAFLWDMAGILNFQLYYACIGVRLVFKHTYGEKSIFTKDTDRLFPFPNQLESEIMRVLKERKRIDGLPEYFGIINSDVLEKEGILKKGLIKEIVDNTKGSLYFQFPDFFNPSFGEYAWTKQTVSQNKYHFKRIDMENHIEFHLPFSASGMLDIVRHILKSINDNTLTDLLIILHKDNKMYSINDGNKEELINIVITLKNYLYSDVEISDVLLEWSKMLIFRSDNGYITKYELDFEYALVLGYIDGWITKYYGCRVTKLVMSEGDIVTRFWLPENYRFLDEEYQNEFSEFDKNCHEIPPFLRSYFENLADNAGIFMYQHKPQKIMPYKTMRRMFVELILPQHFAFRRTSEYVYIPDYIDKISLPIFGREIFGISDEISKDTDCGSFFMI
jgi:hypothetical protein